MRPGDVFVLNDAYRGGVHTNDLLVYRPVFTRAHPRYFTATMIHVSDLGGLSAGGMAPLATDIYLEGLQLPPVRLATADGLEPAVEAILRANSRTPDKVMGDVRALVAGTAVAATRIDALVREYGETGLRPGSTPTSTTPRPGPEPPWPASPRPPPPRVVPDRRRRQPRHPTTSGVTHHRPGPGDASTARRCGAGGRGLRGDGPAGAGGDQRVGVAVAGGGRVRRAVLPGPDDPDERRLPARDRRTAAAGLAARRPLPLPLRRPVRPHLRRHRGRSSRRCPTRCPSGPSRRAGSCSRSRSPPWTRRTGSISRTTSAASARGRGWTGRTRRACTSGWAGTRCRRWSRWRAAARWWSSRSRRSRTRAARGGTGAGWARAPSTGSWPTAM